MFAKKADKYIADAYASGSTNLNLFDKGLKDVPEDIG